MHLYVGLNIRLHNIYIYLYDSICMIVYESEHVWHLIMYIIHDSESYVLLIHDNVYIYIHLTNSYLIFPAMAGAAVFCLCMCSH